MPKGPAPDEGDEPELPPLDADDDDEHAASRDVEDLGDLDLDDDVASLDDACATDLDIGGDLVSTDDPHGDADPSQDAEGLDIGDLDDGLVGDLDARPGDAGDDDGVSGEDLSMGIDDDDDSDLADGGAEGTDEAPEDAIEESRFPELDADDDGDQGDDELLRALAPVSDELEMPPWADVRWGVPRGAGASIPCTAVSVMGGRVAAAGGVLLTVDEGAHSARQIGAARDVRAVAALSGGAIAAATSQGIFLIDVGHPESPTRLFEPAPHTVSLAFACSRLWARCHRALWAIPIPPSPPVSLRKDGVRAIAGAGRALVALTQEGDELALERLGGDDEVAARAVLKGEARRIASSPDVGLAAVAGGEAIALWGRGELALRRGQDLTVAHLPPVVAAAFAGVDVTAPLCVVVHSASEWALLQIPYQGVATRLATLGPLDPADAPQGVSVAWDETRELLWLADSRGLSALGPTQDH